MVSSARSAMSFLLVLGFLLTGCSVVNIVKTDPLMHTIKAPDGRDIFKDNPEWRAAWANSVNSDLSDEVGGYKARGGKSWEHSWRDRLASIITGHENPDWYVTYFVEKRRMYGLPAIPVPTREEAEKIRVNWNSKKKCPPGWKREDFGCNPSP